MRLCVKNVDGYKDVATLYGVPAWSGNCAELLIAEVELSVHVRSVDVDQGMRACFDLGEVLRKRQPRDKRVTSALGTEDKTAVKDLCRFLLFLNSRFGGVKG
jgi:hypothetical protein